jgi:hypothetical protein
MVIRMIIGKRGKYLLKDVAQSGMSMTMEEN